MRRNLITQFGPSMVLVLMGITLFICIGCGDEPTLGYGSTEAFNVELGVASVMADPITPIRDLMNDPRIASITHCGPDPMNPINLTRDMTDGGLITISSCPGEGDNQVYPVSEYMYSDITYNYYCLQPDGTVKGFYFKQD